MPIAAAQRTGFSRWIHVKAGELAILFVCAVTLFSLCTQALYLGFQGSTIAYQLHITRLELILSVLPHALLELTALFLPLAAWLIASRRGEWNQLLAATLITVADRDPDPGRRRDDRGLRLAAHPRSALAGRLLVHRTEPTAARASPRKIAAHEPVTTRRRSSASGSRSGPRRRPGRSPTPASPASTTRSRSPTCWRCCPTPPASPTSATSSATRSATRSPTSAAATASR